MRRLISAAVAGALIATLGVGAVMAATPNSHANAHAAAANLGKGHVFRVHVSPVVWAGGRIGFTATMARCDASTRSLKVTVTTDLTTGGTVMLSRAGTIYNTASHSRACVWRGATTVATSATTGDHVVTFTLATTPTPKTATVHTMVVDHSTGTDSSGGTH